MTALLPFLIVCNIVTITFQKSCSWSSWSSSASCQWVSYHCIKGYKRHCLCDNSISMGSECSSDGMQLKNYIETKPFVSNTDSVVGICFKEHCASYRNWCPWESWSYWVPVTNKTCERRRHRQCCESQPKSGYTVSLAYNYGCFISKSEQNYSSIEIDTRVMKCSSFTKWYTIGIYSAIGVACLSALCIICRFTRSSEGKIRDHFVPDQIQFNEIIIENQPTAPVDEEPFIQPAVQNPIIMEMPNTSSGLPITPPSYDESIGFNNFTTVPIVDKPVTDKPQNDCKLEMPQNDITNPITDNLPPPSYALYLRNPNLFNSTN